jgi:hypothetical protein
VKPENGWRRRAEPVGQMFRRLKETDFLLDGFLPLCAAGFNGQYQFAAQAVREW